MRPSSVPVPVSASLSLCPCPCLLCVRARASALIQSKQTADKGKTEAQGRESTVRPSPMKDSLSTCRTVAHDYTRGSHNRQPQRQNLLVQSGQHLRELGRAERGVAAGRVVHGADALLPSSPPQQQQPRPSSHGRHASKGKRARRRTGHTYSWGSLS